MISLRRTEMIAPKPPPESVKTTDSASCIRHCEMPWILPRFSYLRDIVPCTRLFRATPRPFSNACEDWGGWSGIGWQSRCRPFHPAVVTH